jgi:hypothetical protein
VDDDCLSPYYEHLSLEPRGHDLQPTGQRGHDSSFLLADLDICKEEECVALCRAASLKGLKVKSLSHASKVDEGMNPEIEDSNREVLGW